MTDFALWAAAAASVFPGAAGDPSVFRTDRIGRSVEDRAIRSVEMGNQYADRTILVVGAIHGNERAGVRVVRRLARGPRPTRFNLWLLRDVNHDGAAHNTRQNARGVDLNRNFPAGWRSIGERWDPTYSGPRPLSEPESRIVRRFILRIRPDVTIWFHQPQRLVRAWSGPSLEAARRYAHFASMRFARLPVPPGAATRWQARRFPRSAAFVVELAPGPLSPGAVRRHARAIRRLALAGI